MNSLATIQRMNNLAAQRTALHAHNAANHSGIDPAASAAEARANNAQPVLTEHEESLMLPGETNADFVARRDRDK